MPFTKSDLEEFGIRDTTTFIDRLEKGPEPVGCALDFVHMKFGGFLGISEETICYYKDVKTFNEMSGDFPSVSLPHVQDSLDGGNYFYVESVETHHTGGGCWVDLIFLYSGIVISLTDECLNVYASKEEFRDEWEYGELIDYDKRSFSFPYITPIPEEYRGNDYGDEEPHPPTPDPVKETELMTDMVMYDYENITHNNDESKTRYMVRVPGGWVYEVETGLGISTCFIPHPEGKV